MRPFLFYCALCFSVPFFGQNLVPNPSFENHSSLHCSWIINNSQFTNAVDDWFIPTNGTSDIYNDKNSTTCFSHPHSTHFSATGSQKPLTGHNMAGIYSYSFPHTYREYVEVKLKSSLTIGKTYYVEMYVSVADESAFLSNNIGMNFSVQRLEQKDSKNIAGITPQINIDTIVTNMTDWVKISGTFTATLAHEYLTIGNFFNEKDTKTKEIVPNAFKKNTYLYIDDVLVEEYQPVCQLHTSSVTICSTDTTILSSTSTNFMGWAPKASPNTILSMQNNYPVFPTKTTTYWGYEGCDTLEITVNVKNQPQSIDLGKDTTFCQGTSLTLNAATLQSSYVWNDSSTDSILVVSTPGKYSVIVTHSCVKLYDTIEVNVITHPSFDLGKDTILCDLATIQLNTNTIGNTYTWQDNSNKAHYMVDSSNDGLFHVTVINQCGTTSDTIEIARIESPKIQLTKQISICQDSIAHLISTLNVPSQYLWNTTEISSTISVKDSGEYWVQATNECGTDLDTVEVKITNCFEHLLIPNVFTPDGNGKNDEWVIEGILDVEKVSVLVYNRWGTTVFKASELKKYWNGRYKQIRLPQSTYYYIIETPKKVYTGTLTILY